MINDLIFKALSQEIKNKQKKVIETLKKTIKLYKNCSGEKNAQDWIFFVYLEVFVIKMMKENKSPNFHLKKFIL